MSNWLQWRTRARNRLKDIARALLLYEHDHHALPPAYTTDANGNRLHSWRTLILPYLDERPSPDDPSSFTAFYKSIDLTKPWDDPVNARACRDIVASYSCPASTVPHDNKTTYLAILTPNSCFAPRSLEFFPTLPMDLLIP